MLSFDEYLKQFPYNDPLDYFDYLSKERDEEEEKEMEKWLISYSDEEKKSKRQDKCPHCNRQLQPQDAVLATTYKKVLKDYHKTYLP